MKKVSLILAAFALVLGLSQCKKEEKPAQSGEKQHIVLTANNGNDGSKVSGSFASEKLNLTWEGTETITVTGGATGTLSFKIGVGQATATFEGDVTIVDATTTVYFTVGSAPESFAGQTGTETDCATWIQGNNHFVGESAYLPSGNYNNVQMNLQYAVLKLDVSALGTSGAMTIAVGGSTVASVTDVSSSAGKAVFVAVPADGTKKTYTISCGGKIGVKTWTLEPNVFYTKQGASGPTGEAIVIDIPKFSVSETTTVEFAPGNLWYGTATGESTPAFHFENNQWDFTVGSYHDNYPFGYYHDWVPNHVSHFYWSNTESVAYAESYNDPSASTDDVFFTNASDFQVNGETGWRTLSKDEWNYLINTRIVNGNTGYGSTCVWTTVEDVSGLIIFHDGYNGATSELTSIPDGCVFLPAAGGRECTEVVGVGTMGSYWSNTLCFDENGENGESGESAMELHFDQYTPIMIYEVYLNENGCSVRLVR